MKIPLALRLKLFRERMADSEKLESLKEGARSTGKKVSPSLSFIGRVCEFAVFLGCKALKPVTSRVKALWVECHGDASKQGSDVDVQGG